MTAVRSGTAVPRWRFVEHINDNTAAAASIKDVADCTLRADAQVRSVLRGVTTVAVFRRVTALPLGVMLCAPEVVTLRHLLSGRGLLPGSGYGEEPGAVVVPAGDGLVPPSLDGPVQREGEAGAGDQPGGVLPGETGEPGGLAGRQPDGGDAGRAGQAGRRGPGRARHRGESAGPRRSRTSAARTRRPARPHQPGSPRRTAGEPGRHTGCSPRRKARPSRPSCGAPRCGRTPRRTPPTSRAARPRSAGPAASSRAAAWWRNPGHRGSGWVVPARSFYGGGGPGAEMLLPAGSGSSPGAVRACRWLSAGSAARRPRCTYI